MAQTITYQRGTTSISSIIGGTTTVNPTTLVTAPSGGVSRVIVTQLAVRNTSFQVRTTDLRVLVTLGQSSTNYSYIGGAGSSGNAGGMVGYVSFQQNLGTSHAGNGSGHAGCILSLGGSDCSQYYDTSSGQLTPFTSKNLAPELYFNAPSSSQASGTLSNQIWTLPSDQIGLKLGGSAGAATYEVVYSFIFITES
jgi:hypothetical protein